MKTLPAPQPVPDSPPVIPLGGDTLDLDARELLGQLLSAVLRRRWAMLISASTVIIAGVLFLRFAERQYSASTRILIHPSAPQILDQVEEVRQEVPRMNPILLEKYYHTQEDILTGWAVAARVVEYYSLDQDEGFVGPMADEETGEPIPPDKLTDRAIKKLRRATTLEPLPNSEIFVITVTDPDPQLAAQLADGLATEYKNYSQSLRLDLTSSATTWLEAQVEVQREALEARERAIQEFRQEHDLESMSIDEWRNSMAEQVVHLSEAVADAERARTRQQAIITRLDAWIDEGQPPSEHPLVASDPTVLQLSTDIQLLSRQMVRASERRLDGFPGQRADRDELVLLETRLEHEVARVLEGLRSDLTLSQIEERLLREQLGRERAQALELGSLEVEYNRLRREADTHGHLYGQILRRSKEIELSKYVDASTVNIIQRARPPDNASRPRVLLGLLVTLMGSLLAGVLAALAMDSLDSSIRDPAALETLFDIRPMGILPLVPMETQREVFAQNKANSAAAECLRSIRTNLLFAAKHRSIQRILVTSGSPREGKTTLCVNFSATMALAGHKVLVVDTDMRRPQMQRIFDLVGAPGLSNVLSGEVQLAEAIHKTEIEGLDVMICGSTPPNPSERLSSPAFDALLEQLNQRYDYVVLDSPPTLAVTDSRILAQKCDSTLLVVRIGFTNRRPLRDTLRALRSIHIEPTGVVCNQVDLSNRGYGYYGYSYYGYYSETEGEPDTTKPRRRRRRPSDGRKKA
jgi:capsular exopolysaccharide synthesis family protein